VLLLNVEPSVQLAATGNPPLLVGNAR